MTSQKVETKLSEICEALYKLEVAGFIPTRIYMSRSVEVEIERSLPITVKIHPAEIKPGASSIKGVPYTVISDHGHNYSITVEPLDPYSQPL